MKNESLVTTTDNYRIVGKYLLEELFVYLRVQDGNENGLYISKHDATVFGSLFAVNNRLMEVRKDKSFGGVTFYIENECYHPERGWYWMAHRVDVAIDELMEL